MVLTTTEKFVQGLGELSNIKFHKTLFYFSRFVICRHADKHTNTVQLICTNCTTKVVSRDKVTTDEVSIGNWIY